MTLKLTATELSVLRQSLRLVAWGALSATDPERRAAERLVEKLDDLADREYARELEGERKT